MTSADTVVPASVVTLLSGPGSKYEAPESIRAFVLYTTQGLLVEASKRYHPEVQAWLLQLKQGGVQVQPHFVDAARIAQSAAVAAVPSRAEKAGAEDQSSQQRAILARIKAAHAADASDIHLVCNNKAGTATFKYRVDGDLVQPADGAITYEQGRAFTGALYNTMCDVAASFFKPDEPQDARFAESVLAASGVYGARVATRPTDNGFVMVLRILKAADDALKLDGLGYLDEQIDDLITIMDHSYGLCLFSGPTGSGKSRTLQVMLSLVAQRTQGREHILTFEQPCEYEIRGANQTPVDVKVDAYGKSYPDFAGGIKNAMRLDPDVIMVGEIRDHESAVAAIEAAQTGHMVYSTLHANGAFEIPARLIGEPIAQPRERVLDPTVMKGMVGQRLVQLLCPACSVPLEEGKDRLKSGVLQRLTRVLSPQALAAVRMRGHDDACPVCKGRGVKKRQVVAEVVRTNLHLFQVFEKEGHVAARRKWIEENGGISMKMHALLLVALGRVDPTDAEACVDLLDEEVSSLGITYPPVVAGHSIFKAAAPKAVGSGS